jgi:hypothetical protein
VTTGTEYVFSPDANDPDGDQLTFSVQGLPGWAEFDSASGVLRGTPTSGDVGSYTNIVISVSDGELSDALPAFAIDVVDTATGTVRLSWTPPTENSDGTLLADLAAYKFYYGLSENDMTNVVRVDNPGISTYVIENLAPNTYYFTSTVVNSDEVESDFSNVTSVTVTAN